MNEFESLEHTASLLRVISQTVRLDILLTIGTGEACVCHLEAVIGQRQAYISQQLMALRKAGIVESRREGRNIYYHVRNLRILDLIQSAFEISNQKSDLTLIIGPKNIKGKCPCPKCEHVNADLVSSGFAQPLAGGERSHD